MIRQLTIISTVLKIWFVFCQEEKYRQRLREILAMIENPREVDTFKEITIVYLKIKYGNIIIYLLKSSGLVTLFFWPTIFYAKRNLFTSNRFFC
jgi:hypothetical protein